MNTASLKCHKKIDKNMKRRLSNFSLNNFYTNRVLQSVYLNPFNLINSRLKIKNNGMNVLKNKYLNNEQCI